jgi:hypothetical protein
LPNYRLAQSRGRNTASTCERGRERRETLEDGPRRVRFVGSESVPNASILFLDGS